MMMPLINKFEHLKIQLEAIILATNNFADENCIGEGGFGKVYKGELVHPEGQIVVALKRLDPKFGQGNPEFWKEIIMLSLYKHENIVSLLGFCDESNEKILVYKYVSRRSLDSYLDNDGLTWIQRLEICIGAARGLAYLHNPGGTQQRVLHRDIKSSNILLDENWNANISDLGLSKFGPANQQYTFLISNAVGTLGYCDPVYIETGLLTKESDVYSFGVVLFEVLCGRLCISNKNGIHQSLTSLVRQYYPQNKISDLIYSKIKDGMNHKSLDVFITIAYRCLNRNLEERPLMCDVVSMLESALKYQKSPEGTPAGGGVLVVRVYEAHDLEGRYHTNPYACVLFRGEEKKTKLVKKNRDPRWDEEFTFMLEEPPLNDKLHVEVISAPSRIGLLRSKESLGYIDISLTGLVHNKWINGKYDLINSKFGRILIEFQWRSAS